MANHVGPKIGISYIELNQPDVTPDEMNIIEEICNDSIRSSIEVVTNIYDSKDSEELKTAKVH